MERGPLMPNDWCHLISHHNTVLYVDVVTQQIRHAPLGIAPLNLLFETIGLRGRLIVAGTFSEEDAHQVSLVQSSGAIRAQIGCGAADCYVETFADERIAIRTRQHCLSADQDGLIRNNREWCNDWEKFLPINSAALKTLLLFFKYNWRCHSDDSIFSLVGQTINLRDEFLIGPARVRLSGRQNPFILPSAFDTGNHDPKSQIEVIGVSGATHTFFQIATGRSFDLFDTLMARRCVNPHEIFHLVERASGYNGFAQIRVASEREISDGDYTLDNIYTRLVANYRVSDEDANRLKAIEIATEEANLFPIAEHCQEVEPTDVVVSDMYLPNEFLLALLKQNDLRPQHLFLTSHGKRRGTVWPLVLKKLSVTEHLGDNPLSDVEAAKAAGISARLTTVAQRTSVEEELADAGFVPLSNLVREARLTSWIGDPGLRNAQLAQIQVNFPLLFLASLHLYKLSLVQPWDNILMSARDCYLWHGLYERLRPYLPNSPTSSYFYSSRSTRAFPSPSYLSYFANLRAGRRNVVADLCGTGWSLSRLIEQAPEPKTDIFLLHKMEAVDWLLRYQNYAALSEPINVHSVASEGENCILEFLNRATHGQVTDVQRTSAGFSPVFSSLEYSSAASTLIRAHHSAFQHANSLLRTVSSSDLKAILERETAPMITMVYRRMTMSSELSALAEHDAREDKLFWQTLDNEAAQRKSAVAVNE
jgi:hypothetical protein